MKNSNKIANDISKLSSDKKILYDLLFKEYTEKSGVHQLIKSTDYINNNFPLSSIQKRFYFLEKLNYSNRNNIIVSYTIDTNFNLDIFKQACHAVVENHYILRTTFNSIGGKFYQRIHDKFKVIIDRPDIGDSIDSEEAILADIQNRSKQIKFDISKLPLFKIMHYELSDNKTTITLIIHHIIADGLTVSNLIYEIRENYITLLSKQQLSCKKPDFQFVDYVIYQNSLSNNATNRHFWLNYLSGCNSVNTLITDLSRPSVKNFESKSITFQLDKHITEKIKGLSKQYNLTVFNCLSSIFLILLYFYTNENDILIGVPINNRTIPNTETMLGPIVNTLILRANIQPDNTALDTINTISRLFGEILTHANFPIEQILEIANCERSNAMHPLIQILFNDVGLMSQGAQGWREITDLNSIFNYNPFDLTVNYKLQTQSIWFDWNYDPHLFHESTIQYMWRNFCLLIEKILINPACVISDLFDSNPSKVEYSVSTKYNEDNTLYHNYLMKVRNNSNDVAIIDGEKHYSYFEINKSVIKLANKLISFGLVSGDYVSVALNRSADLICALLAIWKVGGIYVYIDPNIPNNRINKIFEQTDAKILISSTSISTKFHCKHRINIDSLPEIANIKDTVETILINPEKTAYVLFTSGTSGIPKGVLISHLSLYNIMCQLQYQFPLENKCSILFKTNPSFDVSFVEMLWPLVSQGRTLVMPNLDLCDIKKFSLQIKDESITHINFVPSLLHQLLTNNILTSLAFNNLQYLFIAGEEFKPSLYKMIFQYNCKIHVYNIYGPSEAAIYTTFYPVNEENTKLRTIPIGKVFNNIKCNIKHTQSNTLLPIGIPGELIISGINLAKGYLNCENLSNEKFIKLKRFNYTPMYKTGDLVRTLADGNLEYICRIDRQIKINGIRVECSDVENNILLMPGVNEVAVIDFKDKDNNCYLVAYFTSSKKMTSSEIILYLDKLLPNYMHPKRIIQVKIIPKLQSGKIDRNHLIQLTNADENNTGPVHIPRNEIDASILNIWSELLMLHNDKISIENSFFEIGGNSLLCIELAYKLSKQFNTEINIMDIFTYNTIAKLSDYISSNEEREHNKIKQSYTNDIVEKFEFDFTN